MIDIPNLTQMLDTLNKQTPELMRMVTALSYVLGMLMIFTAVMKFKTYGETRHSAGQSDLKTPVMLAVGGAILMFFPSFVHMGVGTFWNYNNPLQYTGGMVSDERSQSMKAIIAVVKVLGVVAAIRGIHLLSKAGNQGQPNMMTKGVTHVIGGILAVNIYGFWETLTSTLGISIS